MKSSYLNIKQIGDHVVFILLAAKKLGGKLDVVSYHDEVEGEIFPYPSITSFQCINVQPEDNGGCLTVEVLIYT